MRVLEVVAHPRHERDEHVLAEREIAEVGRGAVGDDVADLDVIADVHQRALVDAGVLVGALELAQAVDVDARLGGVVLFGRADDDTRRIDLIDTPVRRAAMAAPESRATTSSMPVPTSGASALTSGTAWRCMFEPISARLASSFSRNGMSAAATETSCFGDTST